MFGIAHRMFVTGAIAGLLAGLVVELWELRHRDHLRRAAAHSPAAAADLLLGLASRQLTDCSELKNIHPGRRALLHAIATLEQAQTLPSERMVEWLITHVAARTGVVISDISAGPFQIKLSRWRAASSERPLELILDPCAASSTAELLIGKSAFRSPDDWRATARKWNSALRSTEPDAMLSRTVYAEIVAHLTLALVWDEKRQQTLINPMQDRDDRAVETATSRR